MKGLNIVVYDVETREPIPNFQPGVYRDLTPEDYKFMGIASCAMYDYETDDYSVFLHDNVGKMVERMNRADLIVGFNIIKFDNALLRACGGELKPDSELPLYDILYWSRRACGWEEGGYYPKNLKLDNHLEGTFGKTQMKTGLGAMAPELFKAGKMGELISYNIADVKRERMLFEQCWNYGFVVTPQHGKKWIEWPQKNFRRKRI